MEHDTDANTTSDAQPLNCSTVDTEDTAAVSTEYPAVPLPESAVRDLLRNDRRCHALRALADAEDGTTSQRELAGLVAARETNDRPPGPNAREQVEVCLSGSTLPTLEEAGAITRGAGHDPDGARTVELTETGEALAALLETIAARTGGDGE